MNSPRQIYLPLFIAAAVAAGVFIGARFDFSQGTHTIFSLRPSPSGKINEIFDYIEEKYVDTISRDKLIDKTLTSMLQSLDPHSSYIPAEEFRAVNEPLQGNFDGIGIEFNIIDDTIRVLSVTPGGPSEEMGVEAGDCIIEIEGKKVAGVNVTSKEILDRIRGQNGTKVTMTLLREGISDFIHMSVPRGKVPINSIEAAYIAAPAIGYIKVARFAANTFNEYKKAFSTLLNAGMEKLILDLRGNPGGYLNSAVEFADDFLPKGSQIVYTQGKADKRKTYTATDKGEWELSPLIILIDEGSASASEIIAGAIQDNDRGTIVGRRSFGKGLVQEQIEFRDSSAVRLTIARYYTPTGRCIQRPYDKGRNAYYNEEVERFKKGELLNADSIKSNEQLKFTTPRGKVVFGGGGIVPDVFVPIDTLWDTNYLNELFYSDVFGTYTFQYADAHRQELKKENFNSFVKNFTVSARLFNDFISFAEKTGVKKDFKQISLSENVIKTELKALIARNIWKDNAYYEILNSIDRTYLKALQLLKERS